MKKIIVSILLFISSVVIAQQTGNLEGTVIDAKTGDTLPGVNVILKGTYYGAATDINGKFRINNITSGNYNIAFSLIGYKTVEFTGVKIEPGKTKLIDEIGRASCRERM